MTNTPNQPLPDDGRVEFEKAAKLLHPNWILKRKVYSPDDYIGSNVQLAWTFWKAALSHRPPVSLADVTNAIQAAMENGAEEYHLVAKAALDAAGVPYDDTTGEG
jgi:hypothetical protein